MENKSTTRRQFLIAAGTIAAVGVSGASACSADGPESDDHSTQATNPVSPKWMMPAEEHHHDATWMCWPSTEAVWGETLPDVQRAVMSLALTISGFEPVKMLARESEVDRVRALFVEEGTGADVEIITAPVDDLWARDTLPCFLVATSETQQPIAAGRFQFNGWGNKQIHKGDTQLAKFVADHLGIELIDSHLTGEGGGIEVDGEGTVLAARSSWINDNRNPDLSEDEIGLRIADMVGAERIVWVDGVADADITDGHIDTLARFASPTTIVLDQPPFDEPGETWYDVSVETRTALASATTLDGKPYVIESLVQPTNPRGVGDEFLSSYVNYYVCNGAVIAPQFGDAAADEAAAQQLRALYPDREVVQVDIDAFAAGGGGIHCATQQQPSVPMGIG